jgi:hypothetical protein
LKWITFHLCIFRRRKISSLPQKDLKIIDNKGINVKNLDELFSNVPKESWIRRQRCLYHQEED